MSKLLRQVDRGEQVSFGPRAQATYKIVKIQSKPIDRRDAFGYWKGKGWVAPDAFSPETDAEIWKDFWEEDMMDPNKKAPRKKG